MNDAVCELCAVGHSVQIMHTSNCLYYFLVIIYRFDKRRRLNSRFELFSQINISILLFFILTVHYTLHLYTLSNNNMNNRIVEDVNKVRLKNIASWCIVKNSSLHQSMHRL